MSSIAISSSPVRTARATGWGHVARVGLATVAVAVAANTLVYFLGRAFVSYDPQFLPLANVSGAIVFTLLRFARRPARTFSIISAIVFVVTLVPDFTYIPSVPGASVAQTAILVLMHIVAAVVIVRMLTTLSRPQAR